MTITEALLRPELREGGLAGLAAVGAVAVIAQASKVSGRPVRSWPVAGVAGLVAAVLALHRGIGMPWMVLLSLGLVGVAGLLPLPWRVVAVAPGALALAAQVPGALPGWAPWLTASVVIGVAALGPELDADHRPGVGPALMAGSALGAWACVPDVEWVAPVAAAFAVVAAGSLWPPLRIGRALVAPVAGLILWAAAEGARGRPAALVGAAAGLGLLIVVPAGRCVTGCTRQRHGWGGAVALVGGQMVFVVLTSRVAGLQTGVRAAASWATALLVTAGVVSIWWHVGARATPAGPALERG